MCALIYDIFSLNSSWFGYDVGGGESQGFNLLPMECILGSLDKFAGLSKLTLKQLQFALNSTAVVGPK